MKNILLFFCFIGLILSCSKTKKQDAVIEIPDHTSARSLDAGTNNILPPDDDAKKYVEFTCTTSDGKAGTLCDDSKGSCKQPACTPIATARLGKELTSDEIEAFSDAHAKKMVQEGFIPSSVYAQSKAVAKASLLKHKK